MEISQNPCRASCAPAGPGLDAGARGALAGLLRRLLGRREAVLVNSRSAALHCALAGQGIGHGDRITQPGLPPRDAAFLRWLGVGMTYEDGPRTFDLLAVDRTNAHLLGGRAGELGAPAAVVDLTGLGHGPAAAVLTDSAAARARAERLDLSACCGPCPVADRDPEAVPGVQFDHRLSARTAGAVLAALASAALGLRTGAGAEPGSGALPGSSGAAACPRGAAPDPAPQTPPATAGRGPRAGLDLAPPAFDLPGAVSSTGWAGLEYGIAVGSGAAAVQVALVGPGWSRGTR
ncbi:hypothetical protein [Streptomyces sp. NPDC089919]|uniref:hypothetical protein n=1 Tax=Streptomyces sp. NPDC089919 TaxID=3155188 RepID=UPI00341ABDC9